MASRRRIVVLFAGLAIALLPWLGMLNTVLPQRHTVTHWALPWVGFDIGLAIAFAAVAIGALHRAPWLGAVATVAGTLLLADAWFDVATSVAGKGLAVALGQAVLMEVPLAILAFRVARREANAQAIAPAAGDGPEGPLDSVRRTKPDDAMEAA